MLLNLSQFNKIIIVGNSCSGKTTLCNKLGKQFGSPHFDLDDFHWLPNWIEREDDTMVTKVKSEILTNEKWIVSGNYTSILENTTWPEADLIIWLKYGKWLCLWRCLKRSLRRSINKELCCNGNYESFKHSFLTWNSENLFFWIYTHHKEKTTKFESWRLGKFANKKWLVFEKPSELEGTVFV